MKNNQTIGDVKDSFLENVNENIQENHNTDIKKLKDEIKKLSKKIDESKNEKYPYMNILIAIFGLTFFFFLFAVFLNKTYDFGISDDSVVLTFVGIAATFVVVSNYMQIKEIETKYEKNIDDIAKKVDEKEKGIKSDFDKKIEKIQNEFDEFENKIEDIENLRTYYLSNFPKYTTNVSFTVHNNESKKISDFITKVNPKKEVAVVSAKAKYEPMITFLCFEIEGDKTFFDCAVWNMDFGKLLFLCQELKKDIPLLEYKIGGIKFC
jgi:gas vesicle protein